MIKYSTGIISAAEGHRDSCGKKRAMKAKKQETKTDSAFIYCNNALARPFFSSAFQN